jgi:hypothetical protein
MSDVLNPVVDISGVKIFPDLTLAQAVLQIDEILSEAETFGNAEVSGDIIALKNMAINASTASALPHYVALARIKLGELRG